MLKDHTVRHILLLLTHSVVERGTDRAIGVRGRVDNMCLSGDYVVANEMGPPLGVVGYDGAGGLANMETFSSSLTTHLLRTYLY